MGLIAVGSLGGGAVTVHEAVRIDGDRVAGVSEHPGGVAADGIELERDRFQHHPLKSLDHRYRVSPQLRQGRLIGQVRHPTDIPFFRNIFFR